MDAWSSSAPIGRTRTAEFMAGVYRWMSFGLALTGLTAWATANTSLLSAFYLVQDGHVVGVTGLYWAAIVAELALVFMFASVVQRVSLPAGVAMFLSYAALSGVTLAAVAFYYTGASIASTFFVTGGAFLGLSLYATTTKHDLSGMRTFLLVGLIGLVLGGIVNLFLRNSAMEFVLSCAGVLVFAGLTAYDTQRIRAMAETGDDRHALLGALALYLDFINLFLYLLRFFGRRRD